MAAWCALVPEYDKKVLIDMTLNGDAGYFAALCRGLAEFCEENHAWEKWVSALLLYYYELLCALKKVKVRILAPRQTDTFACAAQLPW
jgi:hypothetical protein